MAETEESESNSKQIMKKNKNTILCLVFTSRIVVIWKNRDGNRFLTGLRWQYTHTSLLYRHIQYITIQNTQTHTLTFSQTQIEVIKQNILLFCA